LIGLGIGVALFAGASVAVIRTPRFQKWYHPPEMVLPADEEVAEVRASLRASQVGFEAVPEFVVPAEHVPIILGWLRPAEFIREPWRLDELEQLGEVVILARSGRHVRVRFYWSGKNPAVLNVNDADQFYGRGIDDEGAPVDGGIRLGKAIQEAYRALPW
jgi:hypothetical protein